MTTDLYIEKRSIVHDLNFWTKIISFLVLIPLSAFIGSLIVLFIIIVFFILLSVISKISLKQMWGITKLYVIPIAIGVTFLSLAFNQGNAEERIMAGLVLVVRFIILIFFGVFFAMVTNPIEFPVGMLKVGMPHKYGITLMVAFRMFPMISRKIGMVRDAQRARGCEFKIGYRLFSHVLSLLIPIIHSTLETSLKLSDTLISRGYDTERNITIPPTNFKKSDYIILSFTLILIVLSLISLTTRI